MSSLPLPLPLPLSTSLPPCSLCPAAPSSFYIQNNLIYCGNGHSQGPAAATEGDEDFGRYGRLLRRKSGRAGEKGKGKGRKVLGGREAWKLFLRGCGEVLLKCCEGVGRMMDGEGGEGGRGEMALGKEVWVVVRALWEVRLGWLIRGRDGGKGHEESEEEEDGEMEGDEAGQEVKGGFKMAVMKATDSPTLMEVAATVYLGLLILRYPLDIGTFFSWLQTERVPFIRAIRHVPPEIKDRLPGQYHSALDTFRPLEPSDLQNAISRLATLYSGTFGVTIPPLIHPPILLSCISSLALPLQIYPMVKHLNTIVKFSFAYPSTPARMSSLSYPSVQLMTLIVIATKLLFPFDASRLKRYPHSLSDPGVLRMNWDVWLEAKHSYDDALLSSSLQDTPLKPGTELGLKDTDILSMTDVQVDAYMSWYQRMWTNPNRKEEGIQLKILDMFPVEPLPEQTAESVVQKEKAKDALRKNLRKEMVKRVQSSLKARRAVSEEEEMAMLETGELERELLRPGMMYSIFSSVEELEGPARVFFEEAAETACVSVEGLMRAVRSAEDRIEKWRRERRREAMFGKDVGGGIGVVDEMDVDVEGGSAS